jgi:hypothetical protein
VLGAFALLLVLQALGLPYLPPSYDTDDAAFFYRYAENLAAGEGFRFNVEEPPMWGASAPFWPVLIALGLKLGLGPLAAAQAWSWVLTLAATALLGWTALRLAGVLGVVALAPLVAVNYLYTTFATSGMESPLGYFVAALALAATVARGSGILLGIGAGLCLVHKIDMAPMGLAVLAGAFLWRRAAAWRALAVAAGIATAWYGFAWWHFGSPLPNSLVSKYRATYGGVGHAWFAGRLLVGAGGIRVALALAGVVAQRGRPFPAAVALVGLIAPLAAYTWKPPAEPFQWYAAAVSPQLALLGALGLAWCLRPLARMPRRVGVAVGAAALGGLLAVFALLDAPSVRSRNGYLSGIEPVRIAAGRWVDANTPAGARVLCSWGHVAYHSRRFVYDGSFLNRRREGVDIIKAHRPEVLVVHCEKAEPPSRPGYRLLKRFPRPSRRERPLSFDVYMRTDVFRAQLRYLLAHTEVEIPELSPAASAALGKLLDDADPGKHAALAELDDWLRRLKSCLGGLPPDARPGARGFEPWLDSLTTRVTELRESRG